MKNILVFLCFLLFFSCIKKYPYTTYLFKYDEGGIYATYQNIDYPQYFEIQIPIKNNQIPKILIRSGEESVFSYDTGELIFIFIYNPPYAYPNRKPKSDSLYVVTGEENLSIGHFGNFTKVVTLSEKKVQKILSSKKRKTVVINKGNIEIILMNIKHQDFDVFLNAVKTFKFIPRKKN